MQILIQIQTYFEGRAAIVDFKDGFINELSNGYESIGSARGVMVILVGNGHGDTSSNPGRDWLHFT